MTGDKTTIDDLVSTHRAQLAKARTVPISATWTGGSADFLILFSSSSAVESVRFVGGDDALRPLGDLVRKASYGRMFPDNVPAKILRRGILGCAPSNGGCALTFLLPDDAKPVK